MSDPDTRVNSTNSLTVGVPLALIFGIITVFMFRYRDAFSNFKLILWLSLILLTVIFVPIINMISQYINCGKTDTNKAFLGCVPALVAVLVGLLFSSITFFRVPVASVFAPMMVGTSVNITKNEQTTTLNTLKFNNSKECCVPKLTLEYVEQQYPSVAGMSYGFYIFFSILFGMVFGTGFSTIC
jgi:hypothetical protein